MRAATGRWVIGDDFFNREPELRILENRVREGNHVLLTGQRRMGKTSIARELGRRLAESGAWVTLFTDIEDATCPEDVIADVARAAQTSSFAMQISRKGHNRISSLRSWPGGRERKRGSRRSGKQYRIKETY